VYVTTAVYVETVRASLRRTYLRDAAKVVARLIGVSPRTAQSWLDGYNAPHGAHLIRLMAHNDDLAQEIMRLVEVTRCGR
jgi:hypothetical protein